MIASAIMSVLFGVGVSLYVTTLTAASRNNAQISAMSRGTVIMQQIMRQYRESYSWALPTDASGFVVPKTGTSASNYVTTDGSAAALQIVMPATAAVTVVNSAGTSKISGTDFPITYTRSAGATVTYYRSDTSGNPAPNNGQYLWVCGTPPGQAALPAAGQRYAVLAQTATIAANTADAVVFTRAPGTVPAIEVRIIASDFSAGNGQQNSQKNTATIVGKWILSRNHS
jgi:hypothetical protein